MNEDLKKIKKYYGEKMMHLCRKLFPTILETNGLLSNLMLDNFAPSRFLYDDIINAGRIDEFKNYIYSLIEVKEEKRVVVSKTPQELMSEVGYKLYECKSEADVQRFRKYYSSGEELCTFSSDRLKYCHVFFAVKNNVEEIKRKNFDKPERQDEYGTSVISIQFSRGNYNTISIKNRYNHTVKYPDATYSNNLENIIPGLTNSFEEFYNLHITQNTKTNFELPGYVMANDGKYYKYNYEIRNIYYCPNNVIIDNFEVKQFDKEKYIVLDYFMLDLVNKKICLYDEQKLDSFTDGIENIEKIIVTRNKETDNKIIGILCKDNKITIEIDKFNKIVSYENLNLKEVTNFFLSSNKVLKYLNLPNLEKIDDCFLVDNVSLAGLSLPNLKVIGDYFLYDNKCLSNLELPELEYAGAKFLYHNDSLKMVSFPKLKKIGEWFLYGDINLVSLDLPNLTESKNLYIYYNSNLINVNLPNLPTEQKEKIVKLAIKNNGNKLLKEMYEKNNNKKINKK